tara:strand:- start:524 stop:1441 length:918 start_codon:yes stop_codon:yes gene_type:complete
MSFEDKNYFLAKKKYLNFLRKQEILGEPFYDKIGQFNNFYIPITNNIYKNFKKKKDTLVIGLSGGQGSGKSTIAKILKLIIKLRFNLNIINFSIDDYYKTLKDRKKMSKKFNQLFLTRGVPGTHDTKLLLSHLKKFKRGKFNRIKIPQFDKSKDDRIKKTKWKSVSKKQDIIIFEGWCIGAKAQKKNNLKKPINILEKKSDINLTWRTKVNNELKVKYNKIFKLIDLMIFLKVPSFKYVYKWRLLQEKKLKARSKGKKTMNNIQIKKFIMFYERITRNMLKDLSKKANIVISLDKKHKLKKILLN